MNSFSVVTQVVIKDFWVNKVEIFKVKFKVNALIVNEIRRNIFQRFQMVVWCWLAKMKQETKRNKIGITHFSEAVKTCTQYALCTFLIVCANIMRIFSRNSYGGDI